MTIHRTRRIPVCRSCTHDAHPGIICPHCGCDNHKSPRRSVKRTVLPPAGPLAMMLVTLQNAEVALVAAAKSLAVGAEALKQAREQLMVKPKPAGDPGAEAIRDFQHAFVDGKPIGRVGVRTAQALTDVVGPPPQRGRRKPAAPPPAQPTIAMPLDAIELSNCEQDILAVLQTRRAYGPTNRARLAILSGYSHTSGNFAKALTRLRTRNLIVGEGAEISGNDVGFTHVDRGTVVPAPGAGAVAFWKNRLKECDACVLDVLARAYPESVDRETLARLAGERSSAGRGYSASSGNFAKALTRLRKKHLIVGFRASDELMVP